MYQSIFLSFLLKIDVYTANVMTARDTPLGIQSTDVRCEDPVLRQLRQTFITGCPTNAKCRGFIFWVFPFACHWHCLLLASNDRTLISPICFLNYFAATRLRCLSMTQGDNRVLCVFFHLCEIPQLDRVGVCRMSAHVTLLFAKLEASE